MEHAKKFYLVDASQVKGYKNDSFVQRNKPIISKEIEGLDKMMVDIIKNASLTDEQKVDAYNQALSKFQSLKQEVGFNKLLPNVEPRGQEIRASNQYDPVMGVPKPYKSKAIKVLDTLLENNKLSFNDKGEVNINGEKFDSSNISDLLNSAVNPKAKYENLNGWSKCYRLIKQENLPKSLLYTPASCSASVATAPDTVGKTRTATKLATERIVLAPYDSPKKSKGKKNR